MSAIKEAHDYLKGKDGSHQLSVLIAGYSKTVTADIESYTAHIDESRASNRPIERAQQNREPVKNRNDFTKDVSKLGIDDDLAGRLADDIERMALYHFQRKEEQGRQH